MLVSKSTNVKAIFDAFVMGRDGEPSYSDAKRCVQVYPPLGNTDWGWHNFVKRSDLESLYVMNGWVSFMCGVIVMSDNPAALPSPSNIAPVPPPSDIGIHLSRLLDRGVGTDVSVIVDGETFPAHRAVLAARSPVFEAELFGSMADATMPSIVVKEIEPAAFKVMLRFMYTDSWPADDELGDSPTDMMQHLIAAADRCALDRLKLMCSLNLREKVSVDTVGSILVCAETYNCPELKKKCFDFFAVEKNFKEAVFTDGFVTLVQKFPSLAAELRRRVVINMRE
uniref:BTB domain-containing protein n=1 Tax=Arundo donax TaxID=35708 RepID=A0A0A9H6F2_ARUDO